MASRSFEQLRVYQLAEELADSVWEFARRWNNVSWDTVGNECSMKNRLLLSASSRLRRLPPTSVGGEVVSREPHFQPGFSRLADAVREARLKPAERKTLDFPNHHRLKPVAIAEVGWKPTGKHEINSRKVVIDNLGPQLNSYLKSIGKSESQDE